MLRIGVNSPPLTTGNAEKYVITWLKSGKHGALEGLDKAAGLPKKVETASHSSKLFA